MCYKIKNNEYILSYLLTHLQYGLLATVVCEREVGR